ncbi:MAG: helix-turn-helix domain-containing protein [Clostridium perfringens]|nr:helix-turn-helix domain-containing protein [Clostridium perfringens]
MEDKTDIKTADSRKAYEDIYENVNTVYDIKSPILYTLDIIGQKWRIPIICIIFNHGTVRYNELKRKIKGITDTALIKGLKELEYNNLILRVQYNEIPPKVEYSLTEKGKTLWPIINELYNWGEKQMNDEAKHKQCCSLNFNHNRR